VLILCLAGAAGRPSAYNATTCRTMGSAPFVLRRRSGLIICCLTVFIVGIFGSSLYGDQVGAILPLKPLIPLHTGGLEDWQRMQESVRLLGHSSSLVPLGPNE
jgi:hypothetical protein